MHVLLLVVGSLAMMATATNNELDSDEYKNLDNLYFPREELCSGFCIPKSECAEEALSQKELCPNSARKGAVCCYAVPKSETRCRKFGGECTKNSCPEVLTRTKATDCAYDQKCCVLV